MKPCNHPDSMKIIRPEKPKKPWRNIVMRHICKGCYAEYAAKVRRAK